MTNHATDFKGDVVAAIRDAIQTQLPGSTAQVVGRAGHYTIEVTSGLFAGKSRLESQRLVYTAISHLMQGDLAPVHAVDKLVTSVPAS